MCLYFGSWNPVIGLNLLSAYFSCQCHHAESKYMKIYEKTKKERTNKEKKLSWMVVLCTLIPDVIVIGKYGPSCYKTDGEREGGGGGSSISEYPYKRMDAECNWDSYIIV